MEAIFLGNKTMPSEVKQPAIHSTSTSPLACAQQLLTW